MSILPLDISFGLSLDIVFLLTTLVDNIQYFLPSITLLHVFLPFWLTDHAPEHILPFFYQKNLQAVF